MSSVKRYLLIALCFALAAVTFALAVPNAAHAVSAVFVRVVNTSANPVPTTDTSTRFQASMCYGTGALTAAGGFCGTGQETFVVPTTTSTSVSVKNLIIDNVSGYRSSFANGNLSIKAVLLRGQFVPDAVTNSASTFTHWVPIIGPNFSYVNDPGYGPPFGNVQETDYNFGQTTHFAFVPGDTVALRIESAYASGGLDGFCHARLEGYLVTQ